VLTLHNHPLCVTPTQTNPLCYYYKITFIYHSTNHPLFTTIQKTFCDTTKSFPLCYHNTKHSFVFPLHKKSPRMNTTQKTSFVLKLHKQSLWFTNSQNVPKGYHYTKNPFVIPLQKNPRWVTTIQNNTLCYHYKHNSYVLPLHK